ncbi:MAG: tetratricopeptide repeat protein [Syntrophothermus sp.]
MSEMLGNHYFMIRNYLQAKLALEEALLSDPLSKPLRKKLVICYCQTNEIPKALSLFNSLITEDADIIINTDAEAEDCPCNDIVFELEGKLPLSQDKLSDFLILGMLWLYCNVRISLEYFLEAQKSCPSDERITHIISVLEGRLHTY